MGVKTEKFIDTAFGPILCSVLWLFRKKNKIIPKNPKKILIIKLWAIGESILTLPMIKELKKKFPEAQIDVLAQDRNKAVYEGQPFINNVFNFSVKALFSNFKKYDLVFDCEPWLKISAISGFMMGKYHVGFSHMSRALLYDTKIKFNDEQHEVLTYMDLVKPFGIKNKPKKLENLPFSRENAQNAESLLKSLKIAQNEVIIGASAGSAESSKMRAWPADRWAKLIEQMIGKYNAKVLLVGTKDVSGLNDEIISLIPKRAVGQNVFNIAGKTKLKEFFALLPHLKLMISIDSGPMHMAAAQGVKTIGLFCPNTPIRFAPYGEGNAYVYKPILPKPCINVHKGQIPNCKNHNHMSRIEVKDVWGKVERSLE